MFHIALHSIPKCCGMWLFIFTLDSSGLLRPLRWPTKRLKPPFQLIPVWPAVCIYLLYLSVFVAKCLLIGFVPVCSNMHDTSLADGGNKQKICLFVSVLLRNPGQLSFVVPLGLQTKRTGYFVDYECIGRFGVISMKLSKSLLFVFTLTKQAGLQHMISYQHWIHGWQSFRLNQYFWR